MEITIKVSEGLGKKLQSFQERLPEILERGLHEISLAEDTDFYDENRIIALLTSQPTPDQVLKIQPSPELQARVSELLEQNKQGRLSTGEVVELERHLTLEHLVRLAKAHAYKQLADSS